MARDKISQRISQYEDGDIEYNLLSLCESPFKAVQGSVAENARSILDVEKTLATVIPDWKLFIQSQLDLSIPINELESSFGLSIDRINNVNLPESARKKIEEATSDPEMLMNL
jgi:ubiquitin carboxyl-terminal hydrolase L5